MVTLTVKQDKAVKQAEAFLANKHNLINQFHSVDDLVMNTKTVGAADRKAIEHAIRTIRAAIAKELWTNEIYVGRSVLDECVLQTAKTAGSPVAPRVIAHLALSGAERQGFVLYPLVNFGMRMPPVFDKSSSLADWTAFPRLGYAVSGQSHSAKSAHKRMTEMASALGIRHGIALSDVQHFVATAGWLDRNPMLMVRLASHTGDM